MQFRAYIYAQTAFTPTRASCQIEIGVTSVLYVTHIHTRLCIWQMEIGVTGGEEDGVNNESASPDDLYSKPEEIGEIVKAFSAVPNAM
jgi:fructose/tagatose bisphosphate aldolase